MTPSQVPSFTPGVDLTVLENAGEVSQAWATNISARPPIEAGQTVSFEVVSDSNSTLFAVAPTIDPDGTPHFTPAIGAKGSATLSVRLHDDGGTALGGTDTTVHTFTIQVNDVTAPTVVGLMVHQGGVVTSVLNRSRDHPWTNIDKIDVLFSESVDVPPAA